MWAFIGECLLASAWIIVGDPTAGTLAQWSGRTAEMRLLWDGIRGLRALAADRERGIWFIHGEGGEFLSRGRLKRWMPQALPLPTLHVFAGRELRAIAAGPHASAIVLVGSDRLARVRCAEDALRVEALADWPPLAAVASNARGDVLVAQCDGALFLLREERVDRAAALRVVAPESPIESLSWNRDHQAWFAIEAGGRRLHWIRADGVERLCLGLPFPAHIAAASARQLWIASMSENFIAALDVRAWRGSWQSEEVPAGDLRALFVRGTHTAVVGSTRWAWRQGAQWEARSAGPGLLAVAFPSR